MVLLNLLKHAASLKYKPREGVCRESKCAESQWNVACAAYPPQRRDPCEAVSWKTADGQCILQGPELVKPSPVLLHMHSTYPVS